MSSETQHNSPRHTFRKSERLSSRKLIALLFSDGQSVKMHPLKMLYLESPDKDATANQVLITVPKKTFRKAVDRNKLKRRIREAWRLNKYILEDSRKEKYLIAYIYIAREVLPFKEIEAKLKDSLLRLT